MENVGLTEVGVRLEISAVLFDSGGPASADQNGGALLNECGVRSILAQGARGRSCGGASRRGVCCRATPRTNRFVSPKDFS